MNIFSVEGRIGRLTYFFWMLGIAFLAAVANIIIEANVYRAEVGTFVPVYIIAWVLTIFPMVKRLHDLNRSGWVCLLSLIPLINLGLGLYLLFGRSDAGENEYGAPPQKLLKKVANNLVTRFSPIKCSDDDELYQRAYEELENGQVDKALWARLFAQSSGNENKAKAQYIKIRVQQLVTQRTDWNAENKKKQEREKQKQERERGCFFRC